MSSSSAAANKVSFTIRRPTPAPRADSDSDSSSFKVPALPRHLSGTSTPNSPLARNSPSPARTYSKRDSSDEDSGVEDELVTAFDEFGAKRSRYPRRLHEKPKPQGPLVIPALQNRDWRELARKRKQMYVPPSATAATGADGSVGGLGTRDSINSGPQISGLQMRKRVKLEGTQDEPMPDDDGEAPQPKQEVKKEETDDQRALRAILASAASGDDAGINGPEIDIIPAVTEDDAFKQDIVELPDPASLEDYERVPVSQFGAALLRGMGWKEGQAASRKNKGLVEPWLPQSRPALLGIGAKEKEVFDDGSKGKKGAKARPERRYVPVIKKDRSSDGAGGSERESSSRRRSPSLARNGSRRSPSPDRHKDRDDRDRYKDSDRDRERYRDSDRERYKEREGDRDKRREDNYDSSSRRDRDRDRERRKDRSRSKERYDLSKRKDKDRY
ncbi:DExH-box splicing factor binding site-domain-containing protein [Ganoderma leucocontextum]|nr:DExH-box splicing factor binding site-domain-containing protein [Ganoderma leucocontextum]